MGYLINSLLVTAVSILKSCSRGRSWIKAEHCSVMTILVWCFSSLSSPLNLSTSSPSNFLCLQWIFCFPKPHIFSSPRSTFPIRSHCEWQHLGWLSGKGFFCVVNWNYFFFYPVVPAWLPPAWGRCGARWRLGSLLCASCQVCTLCLHARGHPTCGERCSCCPLAAGGPPGWTAPEMPPVAAGAHTQWEQSLQAPPDFLEMISLFIWLPWETSYSQKQEGGRGLSYCAAFGEFSLFCLSGRDSKLGL